MLQVDVRLALRDFPFAAQIDVPPGVTVVVGASGAGKSTLLRLVAGLLRPDAGSIRLDGRLLCDAEHFVEPYRRDIGMVFQEYALFPHLDVAANVGFGLRARGIAASERRARVARMLERFEIADQRRVRVAALSGGQRQRVALARALVIDPAALLLDEPLSALDPQTRGRVRGELRALLETVAVPTLLVTHDQADRAAFPERVVRLERGLLLTAAS